MFLRVLYGSNCGDPCLWFPVTAAFCSLDGYLLPDSGKFCRFVNSCGPNVAGHYRVKDNLLEMVVSEDGAEQPEEFDLVILCGSPQKGSIKVQ